MKFFDWLFGRKPYGAPKQPEKLYGGLATGGAGKSNIRTISTGTVRATGGTPANPKTRQFDNGYGGKATRTDYDPTLDLLNPLNPLSPVSPFNPANQDSYTPSPAPSYDPSPSFDSGSSSSFDSGSSGGFDSGSSGGGDSGGGGGGW